MLVLTRRSGQGLRIGSGIEVRVVRIEGDRVVLGIAAPTHVAVVRSELVQEISGEVREAATTRTKLRVMLTPAHVGGGDDGSDTPGPGVA